MVGKRGTLDFYANRGTAKQPFFVPAEKTRKKQPGLSPLQLPAFHGNVPRTAPTFEDVSGDGIPDLVFGFPKSSLTGGLAYYENTPRTGIAEYLLQEDFFKFGGGGHTSGHGGPSACLSIPKLSHSDIQTVLTVREKNKSQVTALHEIK